jgi:hypothetical protein
MPQWNTQKRKWKSSLVGVNCFFSNVRNDILPIGSPSYPVRFTVYQCRPATRMPSTPSARAGPRDTRKVASWAVRTGCGVVGRMAAQSRIVQSPSPLSVLRLIKSLYYPKQTKYESNPAMATQTTEARLEARRSEKQKSDLSQQLKKGRTETRGTR